jgi:hypothetical protein
MNRPLEVLTYADVATDLAAFQQRLDSHLATDLDWLAAQKKTSGCVKYSFADGMQNYPTIYDGITGDEDPGTTREQHWLEAALHIPNESCDHRGALYVSAQERKMSLTVVGGGIVVLSRQVESAGIGLHQEIYDGPPSTTPGALFNIQRTSKKLVTFNLGPKTKMDVDSGESTVEILDGQPGLESALAGIWKIVSGWQQTYNYPPR